MKVFVTGGSGFIGSAVVSELIDVGHHVVALARSEEAARKIKSLGPNVEIIRGDLAGLYVLKKGAREAEGILHLGFVHEFDRFEECCAIDRAATTAMLETIAGTNKPFVYTNGTLALSTGKVSDETVPRNEWIPTARNITEEIALSFKEQGVRVASVRLPPTVHGKGDKAFIQFIIGAAKKNGKSVYMDDGQNVWPAVARLDAAHLYRLVLEKGRAGGIYHGVADEGVKSESIATAIGEILNVPVASIAAEKASEHFGFLGLVFSVDNPVSSEITRKELGWESHGLELLEDIRKNYS